MTEPLVSAAQVASFLGIHRNRVYEMVTNGELPSYMIRGQRRFRQQDIRNYVESHRIAA